MRRDYGAGLGFGGEAIGEAGGLADRVMLRPTVLTSPASVQVGLLALIERIA